MASATAATSAALSAGFSSETNPIGKYTCIAPEANILSVRIADDAGNEGDARDAFHYPPANDPFVITVGAFDDMGTPDDTDDRLASCSSRGNTQDGFAKPEVLAPGVNIVAPVSPNSYLASNHPEAIVEDGGDSV